MTIITRRRFMAGVGVSAMLAAMGPYSSIFAAKRVAAGQSTQSSQRFSNSMLL